MGGGISMEDGDSPVREGDSEAVYGGLVMIVVMTLTTFIFCR